MGIRDEIGHLAYKPDGTPHGGLCHCDRQRAHYADEDAPQGDMQATYEQMTQVTRRIHAWYLPDGGGYHEAMLEIMREMGETP